MTVYQNNEYAVKLSINLRKDTGIYVFDNESSNGKTRLFKHLRMLQTAGESISTYTYDDKLLGRDIEDALIPGKAKIIMLDRYDMYNGDGADLIIECAKTSLVLVVCNQSFTVSNDEYWCTIEMEAEHIEVCD